MGISAWRRHTASGRPIDEADHDKIRLVNVFQIRDFLSDRRSDGLEPDGAAVESLNDAIEVPDVHIIESKLIDLESVEGRLCPRYGNVVFAEELGEITHPFIDAVGNSRSAAAALRDERTRLFGDGDAEYEGRPLDDLVEFFFGIEIDFEADAKTRSKG